MNGPGKSPPVACNLDSLSSSERARRSELARTIEQSTTGIDEAEFGYRLRLPSDPDLCEQALELILLERRCCPFLSLELGFEPGDGAVLLTIGGAPGVKQFLRENGILGCAQSAEGSVCC